MRRLLLLLITATLLGSLSGCGPCMHGVCDCVDGHGHPVLQPTEVHHDAFVPH